MITINYYIVINQIYQDDYGYIAPVYANLEDLLEEHPDCEYIEVEVDKFDINLN